MITTQGLSKAYRQPVLTDVTVEFPAGRISFVLGPNGSGKTTLLKCLLGLERFEGSVRFDGLTIDQVRHRVAAIFDDTPFYPHLSGRRNLQLLLGPHRRLPEDGLVPADLLSRPVREYSHGQRKRLALMLVSASGADLLVLDEISTGLDHGSMLELRAVLSSLARRSTIVATGHQFDFYEPLIDRLFVLTEGHLLDLGDFQTLGRGLKEVYEEHFVDPVR